MKTYGIIALVAFSICHLLCCKSKDVISDTLTKPDIEIGYPEIYQAWRDVGLIERYKAYCPTLVIKIILVDDYNTILVHYDEKADKAWIIGSIEKYVYFKRNGTELRQDDFAFEKLIFYHDGTKFTTTVVNKDNAEQFKNIKYDVFAYGWDLRETDTFSAKGKMSIPSYSPSNFTIHYRPDTGWSSSITKPEPATEKCDIYLFAKEPVYEQLHRAFQQKDAVKVRVKRPPHYSSMVHLRKPTSSEIQNRLDFKGIADFRISVKEKGFWIDGKRIKDKSELIQRLEELSVMSFSNNLTIEIEISKKSNDQHLKDLFQNIDLGNIEYIISLK